MGWGLVSVALAFGIAPATAHAVSCTGTGYEKGSNRQTALFNFTREETVSGHTVSARTKFTDPSGTLLVDETAVATDDGRTIVTYVMDRKQTSEVGKLTVHDGKADFSWTKDGKAETETEDMKPNLIIGPSTVPYLQAHWTELMNGQDVETRYAAIERKETVGFKFFKIGDVTAWNGQPAVQIKMKPTSFVIAAIVDPLIFTFSKDGQRLLELEGRALPKKSVDGKWKDLDADMVYRY